MIRFIFLGILLSASAQFAQGKESLPRGKTLNQGVSHPVVANLRRSCLKDFASPVGGNGIFLTTAGDQLYFLAVKLLLNKAQAGAEENVYEHVLYNVSMPDLSAKPMLSIRLGEMTAFVTQGNPIEGITGVVFRERGSACRNGAANYASFTLKGTVISGSGVKAAEMSQNQGFVQLVATPANVGLFETKRKTMVEFDFHNLQTRYNNLSVRDGEIPLYMDLPRRSLYVWHELDAKGKRGLIAYNGDMIVGRLSFEDDDKLLQQQRFFGVLKLEPSKNSMTIKELSRWSGGIENKNYEVHVPRAYKVEEAEVKPHFKKNLALIFGAGRLNRQRWKTVFLYDYEKSWLLAEYKTPKDQYVEYADFSPLGDQVIVELRNNDSDTTSRLDVFDVATRKWHQIGLPFDNDKALPHK